MSGGAGDAARKPINLALQGGGAHGAFAWGVADALLEDDRVRLNAITATSAGAMNAVVIACGYRQDGAAGARALLERFWREVSRVGAPFGAPDWDGLDLIPFARQAREMATHFAVEVGMATLSPYQFNPLNLNPLRDVLERVVDFELLHEAREVKLFISATNVRTGKVAVFENEAITPDHVLASACLPQLFQAVEIDGEAYWDGGFMGNPSLWPLFYETAVEDLLVVHINPIRRDEVPTTVAAIDNRVNEISFNAALLKEMRAVAFVQKLLRDGWVREEKAAELSDIRFHSVRADEALADLSLASKYDTDWGFLTELRDRGRRTAQDWLAAHWDDLGARGTVDLHAEFLEL